MRRNLRNWDTQGWQVQMAATSYPIRKKKCRIGYRLSKYSRLCNARDIKSDRFSCLVQDAERLKCFPKGRLNHLLKQIYRLEFYICLSDMGGEDG